MAGANANEVSLDGGVKRKIRHLVVEHEAPGHQPRAEATLDSGCHGDRVAVFVDHTKVAGRRKF